jgi:hypothetical protein
MAGWQVRPLLERPVDPIAYPHRAGAGLQINVVGAHLGGGLQKRRHDRFHLGVAVGRGRPGLAGGLPHRRAVQGHGFLNFLFGGEDHLDVTPGLDLEVIDDVEVHEGVREGHGEGVPLLGQGEHVVGVGHFRGQQSEDLGGDFPVGREGRNERHPRPLGQHRKHQFLGGEVELHQDVAQPSALRPLDFHRPFKLFGGDHAFLNEKVAEPFLFRGSVCHGVSSPLGRQQRRQGGRVHDVLVGATPRQVGHRP